MFNVQFSLLKELNSSIKNNRDINNYIITGILIFTWFLFNIESLSIIRLLCISIFLVVLLIYWLNSYKLTNTNVWINTLEASQLTYQVNSKGEVYFNNEEEYRLHMVKEINRIYNNSKSDIDTLNEKRKNILRLWVLYLVFSLLLRIIPNITIDLSGLNFIF